MIVQVQQHGFRYRIGDGYHGVDGAVDLDLRTLSSVLLREIGLRCRFTRLS